MSIILLSLLCFVLMVWFAHVVGVLLAHQDEARPVYGRWFLSAAVVLIAACFSTGAFACNCSLPANYGNPKCAAQITAALNAKPAATPSASATSGSTATAASTASAALNATVSTSNSASQSQKQHQTQTATGGNATGGSATAVGGSATSLGGAGGAGGKGGTATASNEGNAQSLTVESNYKEARIPVATAYAASLTSGMDTCLGSMSGGAQTGILGLSLGGTRRDKTCEMIKKAHLIAQYSLLASCVYMVGQDKTIADAFRAANVTCDEVVVPPAPTAPPAAAVPAPASTPAPRTYTQDEVNAIVRKVASK